MSTHWLSVLVPVYGTVAYLDACVESIVGQLEEGVEVVFVDDASVGGEDLILASWQGRLPEVIRVVRHPENRGLAGTRNTLLEQARGDYLWFVDSDDVMAAGSIKRLRALVATHQPDLILCDYAVVRSFSGGADQSSAKRLTRRNRRRRREAHVRTFDGPSNVVLRCRDQLLRGLFKPGKMYLWCKIVRRAAWPAELRFTQGRVFEDLAAVPSLALAIDSFIYAPQVWINYRQHSASIVNTPSIDKLHDLLFALTGFGNQLRGDPTKLASDTLFAISDFCTRSWRGCVRELSKLPAPAEFQATRSRFRNYWEAASPLSAAELARAYAKRGRIKRCLQLGALLMGSRR